MLKAPERDYLLDLRTKYNLNFQDLPSYPTPIFGISSITAPSPTHLFVQFILLIEPCTFPHALLGKPYQILYLSLPPLHLHFTFRAFSRRFDPKRLTISAFVRRKRNNISPSVISPSPSCSSPAQDHSEAGAESHPKSLPEGRSASEHGPPDVLHYHSLKKKKTHKRSALRAGYVGQQQWGGVPAETPRYHCHPSQTASVLH